jgi:hypothetical protein
MANSAVESHSNKLFNRLAHFIMANSWQFVDRLTKEEFLAYHNPYIDYINFMPSSPRYKSPVELTASAIATLQSPPTSHQYIWIIATYYALLLRFSISVGALAEK